jgi:hypothetical protein
MADPFGNQDQGGKGRRPAQTIEATATEISVEPTGEEAARAGHDETQDQAEDEREFVTPDDETEARAQDHVPPSRATLPEIKSFVTHLAAGVLGGLIGVVALALVWGLPSGKTNDEAPALSGLDRRIAKLESAPAQQGNGEQVTGLDARVKALEQRPEKAAPDLSDLTSRVAQLETSMKALADTAKEGGSVADAAAVSQHINEAEQRLQAKIDAALASGDGANASTIQELQNSISELKAKIAALADAELGTGSNADLGPEVSALSDRVGKLEKAVGAAAAGTRSAALVIAFANLKSAVSEGRPFAIELDTLSALYPDLADLGIQPSYAEKGIPTVAELTRSFEAARDKALAIAAPASDGSILDSLLSSAQSLVKIRRVDAAPTGEGPAASLARAEAALDKGDLAGSVKEIETLEGAPREAFSGWLDQARTRLGAEETLKRLQGTLLETVGGATAEPAQP